ncbi:MAG: universal stress protein [Rhodoferax sp.]
MFKRILIPVDGSPTSTAALQYAIDMAKSFGAAITAVTFYDPYPIVGIGLEYAFADKQYLDAVKAESAKNITMAKELIEAHGLQADTRVLESDQIWRAILDLAETIKAELIVMGSHGRSGLEKLVMGSVTQRVLQHTKLPVLVVRD